MVKSTKKTIKDAARFFGVSYSTAKLVCKEQRKREDEAHLEKQKLEYLADRNKDKSEQSSLMNGNVL